MNENHEINKTESTENVPKRRKNDLRAKIICVLSAIILWFYVVSSQTIIDERKFSAVPIMLEQENALTDSEGNKMSVIEGFDYTVDIVLAGTLGELNRLDYDDIVAYVNLSSIEDAGEQTLEVHTRVPGSLTVKEMSTSTVTLYVDRTSTATYDIEVEPVGYSLESGYIMEAPIPSPRTVTVSGPLSVLENIKGGKVDVQCGKLTNSIEVKGALYLVDENGETVDSRYLDYDSNVTVEIPVVQTKNVALDIEFKYGYHSKAVMPYTITPSYITLKGEPNAIKRIDDPFIIAVIDEKNIMGKDKYTSDSISFDLPDGVEVVNARDAVIEFDLSKLNIKDVYIDTIKVNNEYNLSYSIIDTGKVVTLRGNLGLLAMLDSYNLELEIDLNDYVEGAGIQYVPAKVIIPEDLSASVYELGNYEIKVEIY